MQEWVADPVLIVPRKGGPKCLSTLYNCSFDSYSYKKMNMITNLCTAPHPEPKLRTQTEIIQEGPDHMASRDRGPHFTQDARAPVESAGSFFQSGANVTILNIY